MYYLSEEEAARWRDLADEVLAGDRFDPSALEGRPEHLRPAACFYLANNLIVEGRASEARQWLALAAESEPIRMSAYLLDYLDRHGGTLAAVQPSFTDPRPWVHFSSLPHLRSGRERLCDFCARSLPAVAHPLRMMDIGCGNGALTVAALQAILDEGKAGSVGAVLLLDPAPEMLAAARKNVEEAFPDAEIIAVEGTLQQASQYLPRGFDFALCALAVHHMPYELKSVHVGRLAGSVHDLVVFELGANHDTPERCSPELAFSIYQTFGQSLEYIFAQEAPADVQQGCADIFVMSETISLLTEARGERTEYHMPRKQWHELLSEACSPMTCLGETTCYSDEYCELVALHYGR